MKSIVVGSDHYNTLWVIRSLGYVHIQTILILRSCNNNCFVAKSKYVDSCYIVRSNSEVIDILLHLDTETDTVLFSTDDVISEEIDRNSEKLTAKFILPICYGHSGSLAYWMNKWNMNLMARDIGFNIPWTRFVDLENENMCQLSDIPYPCIIKPLTSKYGSKFDVRICRNSLELSTSYDYLKNVCKKVIVQEYIKPDFEFTVDCLRYDSNNIIIPGIIRKDSTTDSMYNLGMVKIAHTELNIEKYVSVDLMKQYLNAIEYKGLCSFDFFVKDHKTYFLETNLRTDGDMFIYTNAGVNFPELFINMCRGSHFEYSKTQLSQKPIFGMLEISYIKYFPILRPWQAFCDWWKTDCYSIFSWSDIKPFIFKIIYGIQGIH